MGNMFHIDGNQVKFPFTLSFRANIYGICDMCICIYIYMDKLRPCYGVFTGDDWAGRLDPLHFEYWEGPPKSDEIPTVEAFPQKPVPSHHIF